MAAVRTGAAVYDWFTPEPENTRCKHSAEECSLCGTSNRRDAKHTTKNGRGAVGSIRRPK